MSPRTGVIVALLATIDLAAGVQVLLGAIALVTALAVGSRKRDKAYIQQLERDEQRLKENLAGASARADEAERANHASEKEIAALEREVAILKQYAAPEAFKEIVHELGEIRGAMTVAIGAQGDLIQHNADLLSQSLKLLESVSGDFGRMAERLGASGDRPAQM